MWGQTGLISQLRAVGGQRRAVHMLVEQGLEAKSPQCCRVLLSITRTKEAVASRLLCLSCAYLADKPRSL